MDALELQAALVKLDPATTVTPIGSNVKLVVPHLRIAVAREIDDKSQQIERKLNVDTVNVRKLTNQNHQNSQNPPQITKCNVIEVR